MTNKEILQADLLDILFEKRNKSYGAYALRRGYDNRLLAALGAGLGMAGLFMLGILTGERDAPGIPLQQKEEIVIREYAIPQRKPDPPKPATAPRKPASPKPPVKRAQSRFVNQFEIKKEPDVQRSMTAVDQRSDKQTGDTDQPGLPDPGTVQLPEQPDTGAGSGSGPDPNDPAPFTARESAPEFPGGAEALYQFLARNLRSPEDLRSGEKILVKVRFRVETDGTASAFEIMESGGKEFDNEVLRVCRKMPRWKPAFQNGIHVPVNYMVPVTFMGTE